MLCSMPIDGVGSRSSLRQTRWVVWTGARRQWAADAGRVDTGELAHARDRISIERRPAIDRGELLEVERDPGGDDVRGIEADRRLEKIGEGTQHQARGDERNDRQRDLGQDEAAMQAAAAQLERSRAARVERLAVRVAREGERGYQAEDDARHHGQPRGPQHHDAVDGDLGLTREMHRPKPVQHADAQPRQQQAACAAEDGDDQVLGKELPHQTEPRGAERASDRKFTLTCLGARQEQVGDVDARDEKHEPDRRAEREQRRLHVARDDLAEWPHGEAQPVWVRPTDGWRRNLPPVRSAPPAPR